MKRRHFIQTGSAAMAAAMATPAFPLLRGCSQGRVQVFEPESSDALLVNPGMGFETFNCFNDEERDLAAENYPECSISYHRYYWDRLEPEEGKYNFDLMDEILEKCAKHKQDLALRFMPISPQTKPGIPEWYMKKAKGYAFDRNGRKGWSPDWNDPYYLDKWEALTAAFGERYNGHRHMDRLEIGGYGFWSEWHISHTDVPVITEENAFRLIDMNFKHWDRTPMMMLIGYEPGLRYAVKKGAGWRADSLGDWGHFSETWNHMENMYPRILNEEVPEAREAWKNGPIAFEPPGRMNDLERYVPSIGGGYDNMWDKALEWGGSAYNAKSGDIPDSQIPSMERFLKRCGYRFNVKRVEVQGSRPEQSGQLPVSVILENTGVAPVYRDYSLAFRLEGGNSLRVVRTGQDMKSLLPGEHEINLAATMPGSLEKGSYRISLGIVYGDEEQPAIRLANKGCDAGGWLPLEGIKVQVT